MARQSLGDIFGVQDDRPPLAAIFGADPDFSDVEDGSDALRRQKRQQLADTWKAAAQGGDGLGRVPTPDTSPSAVLGSAVDLAGATAANANVGAAGIGRLPLVLTEKAIQRAASPFREAAQTQADVQQNDALAVAQRLAAAGVKPQNALGGDVLRLSAAPQSAVPDPLAGVQEMTGRAQENATRRLAESSGDLADPLSAAIFEGSTTAGLMADASQYVGGHAAPFGVGADASVARRAVAAASDMTPEEAAYMARRAKVLPTIPGAREPLFGPGAIADSLRPESQILQVGTHADNAAQDVAMGLRARPQDAADAAELSRMSQALDENAAPSLPRQAPPSLAEIFGDTRGGPDFGTTAEGIPLRPQLPIPEPVASGLEIPEPPPGSPLSTSRAPFSSPLEAPAVPETEQVLRHALTGEELPLDTPYTGTKNAVTEGERIARGLPEVEALARRGTGDIWAEARQRFDTDPEAARTLAVDTAARPRALTPVERDLLLHDRMKLTLDHRQALSDELAALDSGDQDAIAVAKIRRQSLESAFDTSDTALKRAGSESGASLQAIQRLISEDYSPLYLRQRLTVAARESGAAELPGANNALMKISKQLEEAHAKIAGYEDSLSQAEAEKAFAAMQRQVAAAERSGVRRASRADLDAEYEALGQRLDAKARKNQSTANMSGGLDPETVGIISKMAGNRVQAGGRGLGDVVDSVFQRVRNGIDGLEPREVRDAISGYGVVRPQQAQSEAAAELAKIRQQARLVSKLEDLQAGNVLPKGAPRPAPAPEVAALQEKLRQVTRDLDANPLRSDAERLAAMKTRLEKRITDAERGLAPRAARAPLPDTPETATLRKKLAQVMDEHGLSPDPEAQRLAALKTRLTNRAAELEKHIAEGYIPKKVRRPVALDSDAIALQGRVNSLKRQADLIIRKQELAGRSATEKGLDLTAGWGRFIKLTGVSTVQKLASAAAERALVFRPIEELIGAGWSKVPGVSKFAKEASIEGGGSLSAVAKSYGGFFGKAARQEMAAHFRGVEGPIESALGKPHLGGEVPEWMAYPGHIHAGLKAPAKIAGYEYAMEKQAAYYLKRGQPEMLRDPVAIEEMKARAWEHANRDIFMNDNAAVESINAALRDRPGQSNSAKAGRTLGKTLLPIVKVPTNYVLEATDYLGGLPKAGLGINKTLRAGRGAIDRSFVGPMLPGRTASEAAKLADVVKAGLDALPPGQADQIMRQLKKGTLGAGLISLGATGAVRVGGYYVNGEQRHHGDLQPGQIEIAGYAIPHMILHHPALEALQVGGAIYRAKTLADGVGHAARGLVEQVPFLDTPMEIGVDVKRGDGTKALGSYVRGLTIPPDAQRLARVLDQKHPTTPGEKLLQELGWQEIDARKRKPHGDFVHKMLKEEELGIPGLRDNVR